MNRAQKMLSVLRDGRPHSRREIQEQVGYFLTNNAASELRDYGYDVQKWNEGRNVVYQLVGSLNEPDVPVRDGCSGSLSVPAAADSLPADPPATDAPDASPGTEAGTLLLFECEVDESAGLRGAYSNEAA